MIKTARIINKFSNENIFAKKESQLKSGKDAYSFRNINKTTTHFFFKPKKEDESKDKGKKKGKKKEEKR